MQILQKWGHIISYNFFDPFQGSFSFVYKGEILEEIY